MIDVGGICRISDFGLGTFYFLAALFVVTARDGVDIEAVYTNNRYLANGVMQNVLNQRPPYH